MSRYEIPVPFGFSSLSLLAVPGGMGVWNRFLDVVAVSASVRYRPDTSSLTVQRKGLLRCRINDAVSRRKSIDFTCSSSDGVIVDDPEDAASK
jgi:hypothetical protein